jgi:hypothetical protein
MLAATIEPPWHYPASTNEQGRSVDAHCNGAVRSAVDDGRHSSLMPLITRGVARRSCFLDFGFGAYYLFALRTLFNGSFCHACIADVYCKVGMKLTATRDTARISAAMALHKAPPKIAS